MHSWVPASPRALGGRGSRQESFTCPRKHWQSQKCCGKQPEGPGRGQRGEGGLPSHAPPQADSASKDEFVYSQETGLPASREKGLFYWGLEGPGRELASTGPSESETHGPVSRHEALPRPSLAPAGPLGHKSCQTPGIRKLLDLPICPTPPAPPRGQDGGGCGGERPGPGRLDSGPPLSPSSSRTLWSPECRGAAPREDMSPWAWILRLDLLPRSQCIERAGGVTAEL